MSFKRFDPEDFVVSSDAITATAWSGNAPRLTTFHTSSVQEGGVSGKYYLNVYQTSSTDPAAEVQFNIAYGNSAGSGSELYNTGILGYSPTSTVYGQFQNLVLGDENTNFSFDGVEKTDFYAITVDRQRFKEKILPGTFNISVTGSAFESTIQLTDNSKDTNILTFNEAGRVFQIVSGSNGRAIALDSSAANNVGKGTTESGSYGLFLPDIGTFLLNASALDLPKSKGGVNLGTVKTSNTDGRNNPRLFTAVSGGFDFQINSEETITSDFAFIRARNAEFNYSENPSFISGSQGTVIYDLFINNPQTYITTVGLYNDANELLAVAKLSKPLKKDFTKEALVRVKLDF